MPQFHDADVQYHTQEPSWKTVLHHFIIALGITIFAILHVVQPDLDFIGKTSIFLRPLSPLWIIVPFSVFYPLWLNGLSGYTTPRKAAMVVKTWAGNCEIGLMCLTGIVCASTLTLNALNLLVMMHTHIYPEVPTYEAGNASVECEWAGYIYVLALTGVMLAIPIYLQWLPVMSIMKLWTTTIKSTYYDQRGDHLSTNIDKSTATQACSEGASAINDCPSVEPGPKENQSAMASDWDVLDTASLEKEKRERLKDLKDRLTALHIALDDLNKLGALRAECEEKLIGLAN